MEPVFRESSIQFSLFFLAVCLNVTPFVGPSALVAWVLATSGLVALGHAVAGKRPTDNSKKPIKRKSR